jgi:hypothetical protein
MPFNIHLFDSWEGLFPLWNDHNYTNVSLDYWRQDLTKEQLMVEYDGFPLWCRALLNFFNVDSGSAPNLLRVWLTGMPSRYLDEMDPVYIQTWVMRTMRLFLGSHFPEIPEPLRMYQSKWWSNPYTRGTYSYRTLDSEANDVWARDLGEPILHVGTSGKPVWFHNRKKNLYKIYETVFFLSNYWITAVGAFCWRTYSPELLFNSSRRL